MTWDLYSVILFAAVAHCLIFVAALLTGPQSFRRGNVLLAILIVTVTYSAVVGILTHGPNVESFVHLIGTSAPTSYLLGPLLYFYVRAIANPDSKWAGSDVIHFIPFALACLAFMPLYLADVDTKIRIVSHWLSEETVHISFCMIHILAYLVMTNQCVRAYHRGIKESYSDIEFLKLNWLSYLTHLFWLDWIFAIVVLAWAKSTSDPIVHAFLAFPCFIVGAICFYSLRKSRILTAMALKELGGPIVKGPQYKTSSLSEEDLKRLKVKLFEHLSEYKLYRNSNLRLKDISRGMKLPEHQLSQVINIGAGMSFYDLINQFRIEESQELLKQADLKMNILEVAIESGFNSKSVFNAAFKKKVGLTPSHFRDAALRKNTASL